ncbi:PIN domain-containing protein [Dichotomocladium elegans]|nr:PIN domain-containing protein [Dichotomocladium elegans]
MNNKSEFMDLDGPEFISEVNHQITAIRAGAAAAQSFISSSADVQGDLRAYYEYYRFGFKDPQTAHDPSSQVAVLDTNFLISNLGYLRDLTQQASRSHGKIVLVIPWVVIKELDGLKNVNKEQRFKNGRIESLGDLARTAMRFIEKALREKAGWLRGQKSNEIYDANAKLTKGDDSILDCCLFFHNILQKPVTLLTNDRNLAIKAIVHDIQTLSSENKIQLADYLQSISKSNQTGPMATQAIGDMEVDDVGMYDEDIDMVDTAEYDRTRPVDMQAGTSDIWKSRYAPGNGLVNYRARPSYPNNLDDNPPVLDKYGEVLKPPSSSEGRSEEQRRKQHQEHHRRVKPPIYKSDTIYASAHAP